MGLAIYPWQEELAQELVSFRETLPNGLLIYGPRGIGTIDLVIAYAKSLFCEHPKKDGTPCGECKGCKMAQAFTHPDLRYVVSEAESIPRGIPFEPPRAGMITVVFPVVMKASVKIRFLISYSV